ncbi:MAG: phage portal protein [Mesorhizobium sp.]|nr:phage portal protein [Mesorhizobium sp.]
MFGWLKSIVPGRNNIEKRASASGFTSEIIAARESYISGRRGVAELTATAQGCISLWEGAFALADVDGTDLLDRRTLALAARSVALRGEAVFLIRDNGLVPCSDWDLSTRDGVPRAYRVSISEAGGGTTQTVLAAEVLHLRIGSDPAAPWLGSAPLKRASLTAGLLQAVETALAEVYEHAPLGSQIVPYPESPDTDLEALGRGFRGRRGRVLMRESVHVQAAGGPAPQADWRPADVTPDLSRAMTRETLSAARDGICGAFGVLPAIFANNAQGPLVREAQRHLAGWTLQPIAMLLAEEASRKLSTTVDIDLMRPVQAFDVGGRARALATIVQALVQAKEAGLAPGDLNAALTHVNWGPNDGAA